MKPLSIISESEALLILMNDLRKAALGRRAAELKGASAEEQRRILDEIERDIRRKGLLRPQKLQHGDVLY